LADNHPSEVVMGVRLADRLRVVQGDITQLDVDAIVNAAEESLLGGSGVDGAIHRAAGPGLLAECRGLGGCPTGAARLTGGHHLPARYVIHAVGPVYETGREGEADRLRSCYRESLRLAAGQALWTIAFPCISTGAFGYPKEEACRIAAEVVLGWLAQNEYPRQVTFCCYEPEDADLYRQVLRGMLAVAATEDEHDP
jgi:O-acetyl-ADP-ribose deacetylase (regulator of RNase III)